MPTDYGYRLKALRKKMQVSPDEFARMVGVPPNLIIEIEQKTRPAPVELKSRVALTLPEYSVWLVTGVAAPRFGQIDADAFDARPTLHVYQNTTD